MTKRACLVSVIGLAVLIVGCFSETLQPKSDGLKSVKKDVPVLGPGLHTESLSLESGTVLRYTISIPESFDPARKTPLVMGLHYGGQVTPHYSKGFVEALILPGLKDLGAVIVAPDSPGGGWNHDLSEGAVLELMDYVSKTYNTDQDRTLLTGFSLGGHGTWYIGSRNQERFSALIPIAGAPVELAEDVDWRIPIYIIHSKIDRVVSIKFAKEYVQQMDEMTRGRVEFAIVEDLPHYQTSRFAGPLNDAVPWIKEIWNR